MFGIYADEFATLAGIYFVALLIPGADFAIITKNSLQRSRKCGLYTALGTATGSAWHCLYTVLLISWLVSAYPAFGQTFLNVLLYVGSAYLVYLGVQGLRAKPQHLQDSQNAPHLVESPLQSYLDGLKRNALNPNAVFFIITIFTGSVSAETPMWIKLCYAGFIVSSTVVWCSIVAWFFSEPALRDRIQSQKHWVERILGLMLIYFGVTKVLGHLYGFGNS